MPLKYYRILIETGKKKNLVKKVFTQQPDIIGALDVAQRAKRGGNVKHIIPISI